MWDIRLLVLNKYERQASLSLLSTDLSSSETDHHMRTLIGVVVLAFWLGYLSASCGLFDVLVQVKEVLYIHCTIGAIYFIILIPLERIAEAENCKNPKSTFRTSAKEHLQRRGSF